MPFGWEGKLRSPVYAMRNLNQIRCSLLYSLLSALAFQEERRTAKLAQSVIFK